MGASKRLRDHVDGSGIIGKSKLVNARRGSNDGGITLQAAKSSRDRHGGGSECMRGVFGCLVV